MEGKTRLIDGKIFHMFTSDGKVTLSFDMNLTGGNYITLPRIGVMFEMPKGTENMKYFGCGPYESYEDKYHASNIGIYSSTVSDNFEHYIRSQENMAHSKTRWTEIYSESGHGLMITATDKTPSFSFNCSHYTPKQLTETKYDYELVPKETTVINMDYKQAGIG